jgi:cytochrome c553
VSRWIVRGAGIVTALVALVFLVVGSGVIPVNASSGHWAITDWFLHFAMRRSVVTHTLGVETPPLDDPDLVLKGAGHYEGGCRPCHGGPEAELPVVARGMTPHPPELAPRIAEWYPRQLFYIVKHGIKFTGMPAWPAQQRDDEVWAVVAFLRALPDLDALAYQRLVYGETATRTALSTRTGEHVPEAVGARCARCHGMDGRGRGDGAFPRLAGQRPAYLLAALEAYARGQRHSGIMEPFAADLTPEETHDVAHYYARAPARWRPRSDPADAAAIERGEAIALHGIRSQRVPSCIDCHGPGGRRRNPHYPLLAGQYADYLVLQLELFKRGQRGGSAYAHLMLRVASRLTPKQMRDAALYYQSLPPATDSEARHRARDRSSRG